MKTSNTQFTVAEYVKQMQTGDLKVNKDYQRSNRVWPPAARSYLIDSIIHGYPIPKLSLYQKTDVKTRTTTKEIVDGQQRSQAILDFFEGRLRISGPSTLKGKTYEQLDEEDQKNFLSYNLSTDVFAAATEDEIREVFRRINSYNVPLNAAEYRHASYQGTFKWFIVQRCQAHSQHLKDLGIFSEQQLSRMQDAALFSEVCRTFIYGIDHASDRKLTNLYKEFESEFPQERYFGEAITRGIEMLLSWSGLHGSRLTTKAYNVYTILTAIGHLTHPFEPLQTQYNIERRVTINEEIAVQGLSRLEQALEDDEVEGPLSEFVAACAEKTTRKDPREKRFKWVCKAITGKRLV